MNAASALAAVCSPTRAPAIDRIWLPGLDSAVRVLLCGGVFGLGAGLMFWRSGAGMPAAVVGGLAIGGLAGVCAAAVEIMAPMHRLRAEVERLSQTLRDLGSIDRSASFDDLLLPPEHPLAGLAGAAHEALTDAHRIRLEASRLRRDFDDRLGKSTKVATAHLNRMAMSDSLTGLGNRRFLESQLPVLAGRATPQEDLALLVIDMDNFKTLNDTLGHERGDAALRALGEILGATFRRDDAVARMGGDEFVVGLSGVCIRRAVAVAERVQRLFRTHPVIAAIPDAKPTLSIGIAMFHGDRAADVAALIKMADESLYRAKREGRARIGVRLAADAAGPPAAHASRVSTL